MKAYNYLLFRIYRFYIDTIKEKDIPLFYTSCVSATLVYFNLYTIHTYLVYNDLYKDILDNKYYVLFPMGTILVLNHFVFVKSQRFLEYNFKKDIKGGMVIIAYLIISLGSFIVVANYNRAKIVNERSKHPLAGQEQQPSLEGAIKE